jgi:hypothetical protein
MLLKHILFEQENDSLRQLLETKNIEPNQILEFLEKHKYKQIGSGASRYVYDIGDGKVLKVSFGGGQNFQEIKNWECIKEVSGQEKYFTQIYEWDLNYTWIIAEKVKPVSEGFVNSYIDSKLGLTKESHDKFKIYVNYSLIFDLLEMDFFDIKSTYKFLVPFLKNSQWFMKFHDVVQQCNITTFDFRVDNLGLRQGSNDLVVLDYGAGAADEF